MAFQLPKNEVLQSKWTVHYLSPAKRKYNGILYLTAKNLYFEGNFEIENLGVSAIEGGFVMPLQDINAVVTQRVTLLFNQLHIQMIDKEVHVFDRGIMPVGAIKNQILKNKNK